MTFPEPVEDTTPFGSTGRVVYERTYSRTRPDGTKENWPQTVQRVIDGNLGLVYGDKETWSPDVEHEARRLAHFMNRFAIIPAGRQLWASGVRGRQYLMNCWVSHWGDKFSDHFDFVFLRLMEGGGVGANYSSKYLTAYGVPRRELDVHIVCDPRHPDYASMKSAHLLSDKFSHEWEGSFAVEDSREGWAAALVDLIDTYMTDTEVKHWDRVYDVSRVRFKGAPLRTFGGTASGPQPFAQMMDDIGTTMNTAHGGFWEGTQEHMTPVQVMDMDHAIAACVVSGGVRRSARMSEVHWNDPYIEAFINCKSDQSKNWTTNISVEIDQEFLDALKDSQHLMHRRASEVHLKVVTGMLTNGEPGYWNSTLSNVGEPGTVVSCNPCGEQVMEPWEPCNLGHVNLDAFAPTKMDGPHDVLGLLEAHRLMTRFLIRATWGDTNDPKSREVLARNRRIGVGHFGVQGFWAKKGLRYSEVPKQAKAKKFLTELYAVVRQEARDYAFELRIPEPVKVTTMAPTGSIAKMPGVTEGAQNIYARWFLQLVRFNKTDPEQAKSLTEFVEQGFEVEVDRYDSSGNTWVVVFPTKDKLVEEVESLGYDSDVVESQDQLSLDQMLAFQSYYQSNWADGAVSFTCNVSPGLDVKKVAATVAKWVGSCKGVTLMVDATRDQAPKQRITEAEYLKYGDLTLVQDGGEEECASGACPVR